MESVPHHVGPYRILNLLGRGGMGRVFAAEHVQMGQRVALKLLTSVADPEAQRQWVDRFLTEARAMARLEHPGIARVLNHAPFEDTAFLTMDLLEGLSLRQWMQRNTGPVPLQTLLALGEQISAIMADVHAQRVIHRDLKPENVFLCPDDEQLSGYRVKLLDFGAAKLLPLPGDASVVAQGQTHDASLLGTYPYTAPEQFQNPKEATEKADVYSLGILIFELLTRRLPFDSGLSWSPRTRSCSANPGRRSTSSSAWSWSKGIHSKPSNPCSPQWMNSRGRWTGSSAGDPTCWDPGGRCWRSSAMSSPSSPPGSTNGPRCTGSTSRSSTGSGVRLP